MAFSNSGARSVRSTERPITSWPDFRRTSTPSPHGDTPRRIIPSTRRGSSLLQELRMIRSKHTCLDTTHSRRHGLLKLVVRQPPSVAAIAWPATNAVPDSSDIEQRSSTNARKQFDHIVVVAGSAACVLAARLSEDPEVGVALVEAGGPDERRKSRCPSPSATVQDQIRLRLRNRAGAGSGEATDPSASRQNTWWQFAMNTMIYIRGNVADFRWLGERGRTRWMKVPRFSREHRQSNLDRRGCVIQRWRLRDKVKRTDEPRRWPGVLNPSRGD